MSIPLMGLVWTSTMSDATEVAVLSCLASHANDDGQSCFAGVPRIAKIVRRSERTVQRTIDALEEAGWLTVRRGDGAGNLTQYEIDVEKLKGCQDVTLLKSPKRVTLVQKRVTPATKKGDIGDNPPHPLIRRNVVKQKASKDSPVVPASGDVVDLAIDQVMQACGFARRRLRRVLRMVIEQERDKGESTPTTALAMIAAWRDYLVCADDLRFQWGVEKFFGEGYWRKREAWPWDRERLEGQRDANVGVRRVG